MRRSIGLSLTLLLSLLSTARGQIMLTLAGTSWEFPKQSPRAVDAPLGRVDGLFLDPQGNLYLADAQNHMVFRRSPDGALQRIAGNGFAGFSGDGAQANSASLNSPHSVVVDRVSNVYISDKNNHRIRRVSPDGIITTIAGNGQPGSEGDGVPALRSLLNAPSSMALDGNENLYFIDSANYLLRRISTTGTITTVAGNGVAEAGEENIPARGSPITPGSGLISDRNSELYFTEVIIPRDGNPAAGRGRIRKISQTGIISTFAGLLPNRGVQLTPLCEPFGLAFEPVSGAIYVSNRGARDARSADLASPCSRILRIGADRRPEVLAGSGEVGFSGDGSRSIDAQFLFPTAMAATPSGELYVSDSGNLRVRFVDRNRVIRTIAGNAAFQVSAPGTAAQRVYMANPLGLTLRGSQIYYADEGTRRIKRIDLATNIVTTVAGGGSFNAEGSLATNFALISPAGMAFDSEGAMYISDSGAHKIFKVTPPVVNGLPGDIKDGTIQTFFGLGLAGYCGGELGLISSVTPCLNSPAGITVDPQDNIFFADRLNHRVLQVTKGMLSRVVAGTGVSGYNGEFGAPQQTMLAEPANVHIAPDGSILIADTGNNRVRLMSSDFTRLVTIAAPTDLKAPSALATDRAGGIYVGESGGHRIRYIRSDLTAATTIAGIGERGFEGDGGVAGDAVLNSPSLGMALSSSGVLYFSDSGNDRIRLITPSRPLFQVSANTVELTAPAGELSEAATLKLSTDTPGLIVSLTADDNTWIRISPTRGKAPGDVRIYADATGLAPGDYRAQVSITAANIEPPVRVIAVRLKVTGTPPPPSLVVAVRSVDLTATRGGSPVSSTFDISNPGSGSIVVRITSGAQAWLAVTPSSATVSRGRNVTVTVVGTAGDLPSATYSGTITVSSETTEINVPVTLTVSHDAGKLLVSQSGLAFVAVAAGGTPLPQSIGVLNEGSGMMSWTASVTTLSGGDWLSLSATSGRVSQPFLDVSFFDVRVEPRGLVPGEYYGRIAITAATVNSPQFVTVILTVLPEGSNPGPEVRPTGLVFTGTNSNTSGSQDFSISVLGSRTAEIVSSSITLDGGSWFRHAPNSLRIAPNRTATISVQPNFAGLAPGVRRGVITMLADDGAVRNVNVLSVVAPPDLFNAAEKSVERAASACARPLRVQATSFREGYTATVGQPIALEVKVVDECGLPLLQDSANAVVARFSTGDPQIMLVPLRDGFWTGTWRPLRAVNGVALVTVTAISRLGNISRVTDLTVSGTIRDQSNTPVVGPGALRHSATLATDRPVAPGGLISLLGINLAQREAQVDGLPLPRQIDQTEVLLGGLSLPLLYVSGTQINAQVPYDLSYDTQHQVLVRRGETLSVPQLFTVVPAVPGIFTRNEQGSGQGIILKADQKTFAEPSTPAERGETVYVYCAGLGPVSPAVPSGEPAPEPGPATVLAVTVEIGGVPAVVRRSSLVPGVAGRYVVETVVPASAPIGDQVAITVSVAGQKSQQATLAVR